MLELVDEFVPTLNKDDPTCPVRIQGLERTKSGLASMVAGSLQTLTERQGYSLTARTRLLGYMLETFPAIVPRVPPGAQTETMVELQRMQEDPNLKDMQLALREFDAKVKASLVKGEKQ